MKADTFGLRAVPGIRGTSITCIAYRCGLPGFRRRVSDGSSLGNHPGIAAANGGQGLIESRSDSVRAGEASIPINPLDALRQRVRDRRSLPPDPYSHRLAELDAKLGPE